MSELIIGADLSVELFWAVKPFPCNRRKARQILLWL